MFNSWKPYLHFQEVQFGFSSDPDGKKEAFYFSVDVLYVVFKIKLWNYKVGLVESMCIFLLKGW